MARLLIVLLSCLLLARPAAADVVFDLEVQSAPESGRPSQRVYRVYVQGEQVRVEDDASRITLCDGRSGRVYRLDAARKTYRLDSLDRVDPTMSDRLRRSDDVHVKGSVVRGEGGATVSGMQTSSLTVRSLYTVDMATGSYGGAPTGGMTSTYAGPRPGLGVPVGGGTADDGVETPRPRNLRIDGEYQVTHDGPLAAVARSAALRRLLYLRTLPPTGMPKPLITDLLKQLDPQGDLPVASRVTVVELNPPSGDLTERLLDTITTRVTQVASKPLDRMLFIVPADFHLEP